MKKRALTPVLTLALTLMIVLSGGLTALADGVTLKITDIKVGDSIDTAEVVSITDVKGFAFCTQCKEIYFVTNSLATSRALKESEAHSGHTGSVGYISGNWSWFIENRPGVYKVMQNDFAHSHASSLIEVPGSNATCTASGVKTYWSCSCGKYFEDAAAVTEISDIDKWKSVGGAGYLPAGHSIGEWISEVPATCTEEGVKAHADCTVCGKHFDADGNVIDDLSIPAPGHKPVLTYNSTSTGLTITCANEGCDLSSSVLVTASDAVYSGDPVVGSFTADDDFASLIGAAQLVLSYMDENGFISGAPTDAGFYRACISFVYGGITYTPSARFDILAAPIAVTFGDDTEFVFDGTQHTPSYEVKDSEGIVLVKGKDYAIDRTWKDTAGADARPQAGYCAGKGTLIVKGIGNYTGSFSVEYSVDKAPLSVEGIEEKYDYTGEDVIAAGDYRVPDVYGRDLEEGKDFTVVIDDGKDEIREPGEHTIKFVSLNPNYDSVEFSFTIENNGSPKTGYSSNMMLYLVMIAAALAVVVVSTGMMLRKKTR